METKLLLSVEEYVAWRDALPPNQDTNSPPESYPCIVAWGVYDYSNSSWWSVDHAFIYPSDFEPDGS